MAIVRQQRQARLQRIGVVNMDTGEADMYQSMARAGQSIAQSVLNMGGNVSIVFRDTLPNYWRGFKVVDGDTSDLVMLYNKNVVLGLKAKGEAKKDTTNFVVDAINKHKILIQ